MFLLLLLLLLALLLVCLLVLLLLLLLMIPLLQYTVLRRVMSRGMEEITARLAVVLSVSDVRSTNRVLFY